jgi:hypothetical protein
MSTENLQATELNVIDNGFAYEGDLIEQVNHEERGRFMSYIGRGAARVTLVGAVVAGSFVAQGHEEAEATPLAPTTSCTKNGVQGVKLGSLCITKDQVRQPGPCTKTDEVIGEVAIAGILYAIPVATIISAGLGLGWTVNSIYKGGLCGQNQ